MTRTTTKAVVKGNWARQEVILPGDPIVAPRPRVSRWGTYYPKKYKDWMKHADRSLPHQPNEFTTRAHITVTLTFIVEKARTSKLTRPHGDLDNYAKAILDALTKKDFWYDDVDIVQLHSTKRFAEPDEKPATRVVIKREEPT